MEIEQSKTEGSKRSVELRQKLGKLVSLENKENWWRPELFDANTRTHIPSELEIVSPPPPEDENYNCFVYALGLQDKPELLGNNGWEFTRNLGPVFDEMITNHMLQPSEAPSQGNLIVYRAQDKTISHVGVMENDQAVLSKWSWGPLIRHKIFDVPDHYGDIVEFYDSTNRTINYVLSKEEAH